MDLIAMAQTVWRHKFATLPIILLTLALGSYVMFLSTPVYEASGSYILIGPPAPPTQQEIARDPALARVNPNNPLAAYGNLQVVGLMLSKAMSTQSMQSQLLRDGVDTRSTVVNDTTNSNAPLVDITGVGSTGAAAAHAGTLEGQTLVNVLDDIQSRMGVSPGYRVTAYPLVAADQPALKTSSKLRNLVIVMVVGVILLFVAVSVAKAMAERKQERSPQAPGWAATKRMSLNRTIALDFVPSADGPQEHVRPAGARKGDGDPG